MTTILVKLVPAPLDYCSELYDPIRVLWAQVVKRALFDYVLLRGSTKLKDRRDFVAVESWIFSSNVGLVDICRIFGWPLELLRERARSMTREDIRKMEFRERDREKDERSLNSAYEGLVASDGYRQ